MYTPSERKFNTMVSDVFKDTLKPLGYKKKANNFYLAGEVGKIVNLQKSMYQSKDHIRFTLNVGIFSPLYWNAYYNRLDRSPPIYPVEPECVIRKRIGRLKGVGDLWYDIDDDTDMDKLCEQQTENLNKFILPYLTAINTNEDIFVQLNNDSDTSFYVLAKLLMYGELGKINEAHEEYVRLLNYNGYLSIRGAIIERGKQYGLDKI